MFNSLLNYSIKRAYLAVLLSYCVVLILENKKGHILQPSMFYVHSLKIVE